MALIDGLISYWKLDEASGNPQDSHGTNHVTFNNGTANQAGILGTAYNYNNTYSGIPDSDSLDVTTAVSIQCWFKADAWNNANIWLAKRNWDAGANNTSFFFGTYSNGKIVFLYRNATANEWATTDAQITQNGVWYHLVVTFTPGAGAQPIVYVNGVAKGGAWGTGAGTNPMVANTAPAAIGAHYDGGSYHADINGTIDEVAIWGKSLIQDEVTSLYNGGAGKAYPFTSSARSVIAKRYWETK